MCVVYSKLKSESGSDFVDMVTMYLSGFWSAYLRIAKQGFCMKLKHPA